MVLCRYGIEYVEDPVTHKRVPTVNRTQFISIFDDSKKNRKEFERDGSDRIEIERYFSAAKRCNGMGMINKKCEDISMSTITMSVLVTNIFGTFKSAVDEYEADAKSGSSKQANRTYELGLNPQNVLLTKHYINALEKYK